MKNRTENAPGKTGGAGGPAEPGYENLMDDAIRLACTNPPPNTSKPPPITSKPPQGPSVGRYAMVLLVAGPVALLYLLLGVVAQVLRVPSILAFVLAYGAGRVAKWLTAKIMGDVTIH